MRLTARLATIAMAATAVLTTALPASAVEDPPPDPTIQSTGLYVAGGGYAFVEFTPEVKKALKDHKAKFRYIAPWTAVPKDLSKPKGELRDPNDGFYMPVGAGLDGLDLKVFDMPTMASRLLQSATKIDYPGGFALEIEDGKKGIAANGAWLGLRPGTGGFYITPYINGVKAKENTRFLTLEIIEAFFNGSLIPKKDAYGKWSWGPTALPVRLTAETAAAVKKAAGINVDPLIGKVAGHITVRWNEQKNFPDGK
ncbi:hypothetical protein P8605_24895 [Streptomyces sp. T-3]|nr:hypothetical protein [Streptomyces sp. T-3]